MRKFDSISEQIRRNAVALISLAIALASLGYNTWRNEQTEMNRNIRYAAFEMLVRLGELQQIADQLHYSKELQRGDPITGWGYVAVIRDLAMVMPEPVKQSADALFAAWEKDFAGLGERQVAIDEITKAIRDNRREVVSALAALE